MVLDSKLCWQGESIIFHEGVCRTGTFWYLKTPLKDPKYNKKKSDFGHFFHCYITLPHTHNMCIYALISFMGLHFWAAEIPVRIIDVVIGYCYLTQTNCNWVTSAICLYLGLKDTQMAYVSWWVKGVYYPENYFNGNWYLYSMVGGCFYLEWNSFIWNAKIITCM